MYRLIPKDFSIADVERFCELSVRRGSDLDSLKRHGEDDLRVVSGAWLLRRRGEASREEWLSVAEDFLRSDIGDWLRVGAADLVAAACELGLLEGEFNLCNALEPRPGVTAERLIDEIEMARAIKAERRARTRETLQAKNRAVNSGAPVVNAKTDEAMMREALREARAAFEAGEVPVGAVLVVDGKIVARAHNRTLRDGDPTAHAEMLVMRAGAEAVGNHRLNGATLYVTLEPCPMCAGGIVQARPARLVYGASDRRMGAVGGAFSLFDIPGVNHRPWITAGVLRDEAADLLQRFFADRRERPEVS